VTATKPPTVIGPMPWPKRRGKIKPSKAKPIRKAGVAPKPGMPK
jgi:hypothetical protein